jgi:hypothetical protein
MMVSTGIMVTKAIAKCVLSNGNCKRQEYEVLISIIITIEKGRF